MVARVIETTLASRGTDVTRLARTLEERIDWRPGDAVFLSGSIAEGMANPRSDLDIYVVTDRELSMAKSEVLDVDGSVVDLALWSRSRVDELLDRLSVVSVEASHDPRASLAIRYDELTFLHRLSIGLGLLGGQEVDALQTRVDRRRLSHLLFARAAAVIPSQAADVAGLLEVADIDSAAVSAQRLFGSALDAVLAVDGNTNPSEKWRLRRLREHLHRGLGEVLPVELQTFSSYEATRDLYLLRAWPGCDQPDALVSYAYACAHLARLVIPWGQHLLLGVPTAEWRHHAEPVDGGISSGGQVAQPLPRLMPNVMLSWRDGRLVLFAAGGTSTAEMEIGPVTVEALTHFDGRTPLDAATRRLIAGRPTDAAEMTQALEDLRTVLIAHRLAEDLTPRRQS